MSGPEQVFTPLQAMVADYLDHRAEAEKHGDEAKRLATEILAQLEPGKSVEIVPGVGVKVARGARRVTEAKAREVLTPEQYQACLVQPAPVFDVATAKDVLPGALVKLCEVVGAPSLRSL